MLIIADYFDHGFYIIDRISGEEPSDVSNAAFITKHCTDIKPMPDFDIINFPYLLTRT